MNPLHFGQVNPVVWAVSIVFLFVLFRLLGPGRSGLFPGYRQGPDSFINRLNVFLDIHTQIVYRFQIIPNIALNQHTSASYFYLVKYREVEMS